MDLVRPVDDGFVCVVEQVASAYVRNNATYPGLRQLGALTPRIKCVCGGHFGAIIRLESVPSFVAVKVEFSGSHLGQVFRKKTAGRDSN